MLDIQAELGETDDPHEAELAEQHQFFDTHIGPWMTRFFRDMQQATSASFYRAVGQLGEQFIDTDQQYLDMVERGVLAAQYVSSCQIQTEDALLLVPAGVDADHPAPAVVPHRA